MGSIFTPSRIIVTLGLIVLLGILYYQNNKIDVLELSVTSLEREKEVLVTTYRSEQEKFKEVITEQNDAIQKNKIDLDKYNETVSSKEKELMEYRFLQQQEIDKELQKDNSCENQMKIVGTILDKFSKDIK